jgi:hypothetical protein
MRIFSRLSSYVSGMMIKLGNLPGLGFLQNYVFAARAMKSKFGDHAEDYEIYLSAGQDVLDEANVGGKKLRNSSDAAVSNDETDIYDDYEFGDSSSAYHPVDDYPTTDEGHHYYDDDYRAN